MKVLLKDIIVGANVSRADGLGDLTELRESLRAHGQLMPIVVGMDGVTLVAGFRRVEAARQLDWESIEAVNTNIQPGVANLVENLVRENLSLWGEIHGIREVFGAGCTVSEVQRMLGKSRSWVSPRVDAWSLPIEKIQEIRSGLIDIGRLRAMLKESRGVSSYTKNTGAPSRTEISRTVTELLRVGKQAEARALSYALGTLSREELLTSA